MLPARRLEPASPSPATTPLRESPRRKALLALALIVPAPCISAIVGLVFGKGPVGVALWGLSKVWMVALPVVWLYFVEGIRPSVARPTRRGLAVGAASGLLIAGLIIGAYLLIGVHWIDPTGIRSVLEPVGLTSKSVYLAAAAFWILGNSVIEEYVYRWFVFAKAKQVTGPRLAVLISAGAFVLHHALAMGAYFDWRVTTLACAGVFVGGVIWSVMYDRFGSIAVPYVSHAIVDIAVFGLGWVLLFG